MSHTLYNRGHRRIIIDRYSGNLYNSDMSNKPPEPQSGIQVKPRKLTRKQQAFVRELITNPKQSGVQAALATYGKPDKPTTYATADTIARGNLENPLILAELAKHSGAAEMTLIQVMSKSTEEMNRPQARAVDWAVNARQTADSLLDRLHGKATQRVETHSTTVTLALELGDVVVDNSTTTGETAPEK